MKSNLQRLSASLLRLSEALPLAVIGILDDTWSPEWLGEFSDTFIRLGEVMQLIAAENTNAAVDIPKGDSPGDDVDG